MDINQLNKAYAEQYAKDHKLEERYTAPRELSDEEIHEVCKLNDVWIEQEDGSIKLSPYKFAKAILKKASEPNTYKPKIVDMVLRTDNQGNVLPQKEIKESE